MSLSPFKKNLLVAVIVLLWLGVYRTRQDVQSPEIPGNTNLSPSVRQSDSGVLSTTPRVPTAAEPVFTQEYYTVSLSGQGVVQSQQEEESGDLAALPLASMNSIDPETFSRVKTFIREDLPASIPSSRSGEIQDKMRYISELCTTGERIFLQLRTVGTSISPVLVYDKASQQFSYPVLGDLLNQTDYNPFKKDLDPQWRPFGERGGCYLPNIISVGPILDYYYYLSAGDLAKAALMKFGATQENLRETYGDMGTYQPFGFIASGEDVIFKVAENLQEIDGSSQAVYTVTATVTDGKMQTISSVKN